MEVANASLKVQVRRWQDAASLAWSDDDILEVSRYLNESIYHFAQSVIRLLRRAWLAMHPFLR